MQRVGLYHLNSQASASSFSSMISSGVMQNVQSACFRKDMFWVHPSFSVSIAGFNVRGGADSQSAVPALVRAHADEAESFGYRIFHMTIRAVFALIALAATAANGSVRSFSSRCTPAPGRTVTT